MAEGRSVAEGQSIAAAGALTQAIMAVGRGCAQSGPDFTRSQAFHQRGERGVERKSELGLQQIAVPQRVAQSASPVARGPERLHQPAGHL
jgi:hypothetical protein